MPSTIASRILTFAWNQAKHVAEQKQNQKIQSLKGERWCRWLCLKKHVMSKLSLYLCSCLFFLFAPIDSKKQSNGKWKLDVYLQKKNQLQFYIFHLIYHKDVTNLSQYFGHARINWSKNIVSTCMKLWMVINMQKKPFFLTYWRYISNLYKSISLIYPSFLSWNITNIANLYLILWACLVTLTKNNSINS